MKSPLSSLPVPVIALVNVPPVMVPLQVTGSSTALFPALKVAPSATVMLWMFSASSPMVSGWSASSSSFRSTVPVMVSTPFSSLKPLNSPPVTEAPDRFSTVASVKSPPVMEPLMELFTVPVNLPPVMMLSLSTCPEMAPPEIFPTGFLFQKYPHSKTVTSPDKFA